MKRVAFILICVCLAVSMPSFADETIVYENDYNDQTPGNPFNEGGPWNWLDNLPSPPSSHTCTYQDDGTGNIVVHHNGHIDNSGGAEAVNTRFGTKWSLAMSGNTSPDPTDYIIEFDLRSISGNWDPIALEFFVLTAGGTQGYGSGAADYAFADGWVHIEMSLADLPVPWYQGTDWDLTSSTWTIEVGGPPWPGTSVPAGASAWDQIWLMDNLKITQISDPTKSYDPYPQNGATRVDVDVTFNWTPGINADLHDIYLGTDFNDVNDANRTNPMDVLVEQDYDANTYNPEALRFNETYYWRIDDVNDACAPGLWRGSVWSFTVSEAYLTERIVYENDYNDQTPGNGFPAWNWANGTTTHTATYQDDGTGNIVVDHNGTIDNSAGSEASNCRFGSKWDITLSGNTSSDPEDYTISFDLRSVSGNWDPINLEIFVLTYNPAEGSGTYGYGSGASGYAQANGWVHVEYNLADLLVGWHEGTNWDLTNSTWSIELGGPPYPGTSVPAGTPAWNQIWQMDNLKITELVGVTSYDPYPPDGATYVEVDVTFSWTPGVYAVLHDVYLGTDFSTVNDANRANPMDVLVEQNLDANTYDPNNLQFDTTYYWRIDDVNADPNIYKGDVWSFTTRDISLIDDFEPYTDTGKSESPPEDTLKSVWVDGNYAFSITPLIAGTSGSLVQLNTDTDDGATSYTHYVPDDENIAQSGAQSMKFYYDNDGTVTWEVDIYNGYPEDIYTYTPSPDTYLSEAYAAIDDAAQTDPDLDSLDLLRDWSGYNVLGLSFYGDPNNDAEPMYVSLEDGDGTLVTIEHPGPDLTKQWWQDWYIKMSDFTDKNGDLALTDIAKIYIGFGDKDSPSAGGSGVVFFDDIQLFTGVCISGDVIGDLDGDCVVNNDDLRLLTNVEPWYGEKPVSLPTPIINLDASAISQALGSQVTSWSNSAGSMGGAFTDFIVPDGEAPVLEMVEGKKAVTFNDINDMLIWDQNAPGGITGANDFTVVFEVFNIDIGVEEWVIAWTERSPPAGTFAAFGYGTNSDWGAAGHYYEPDMGFGPLGVPTAHTWHTIAFTYDGTTESIVVDGLVYDTEAKVLAVEPDQPVVIGGIYDPAAGGSIKGAWNPAWGIRYIGSVASIKVYDEAIPAVELALWMGSPADMRIDNKIDFMDIAVLGNNWLIGPVLFGEDY